MANDSTSFFYWYRRYKVRAVDMTAFQTAMMETSRGLAEGSFGAAVLRGFDVTAVSGFLAQVGSGIAQGPSGYLDVMNASVNLDCVSATGGALPKRSLIVARATPTDSDFINSPTAPFNSVPLHQQQKTTVVLIPGTASNTPDYPAKAANDVILCGLKVPPSASSLDASMFDFEVRESVGVNSLIDQNQVRFDNRLRPFRSSYKVMGIKPSQTIGSAPLAFSYPGRQTPSMYPLSGGVFSPNDSFIDFATGLISGGDSTTPSFTPTVPTGNASLVCAVTLDMTEVLHFNFTGAVQGTFAQCQNAIRNQLFTGSGRLPDLDGNFPLAWVIITSQGGVLSDVQVYDGRPFLGSGGAPAKFQREIPTGNVDGSNADFVLSKTPADPESVMFFVEQNLLEKTDYTLTGTTVSITNTDLIPITGQSVYATYLVHGAISTGGGGGGGGGGATGSGAFAVTGSLGTPLQIDPAVGIMVTADQRQLEFLASNGGATTVTANPQIAAGSVVGQELVIEGTSDTNYPILNDGNGLRLNGAWNGKSGSSLYTFWNGSAWAEISRR